MTKVTKRYFDNNALHLTASAARLWQASLVVGSFEIEPSGVNRISVRLDPAYPGLAEHLVGLMLHNVVSQSSKLRVEIHIPRWTPAVAEAVESLRFEKRAEYLKMGLVL